MVFVVGVYSHDPIAAVFFIVLGQAIFGIIKRQKFFFIICTIIQENLQNLFF